MGVNFGWNFWRPVGLQVWERERVCGVIGVCIERGNVSGFCVGIIIFPNFVFFLLLSSSSSLFFFVCVCLDIDRVKNGKRAAGNGKILLVGGWSRDFIISRWRLETWRSDSKFKFLCSSCHATCNVVWILFQKPLSGLLSGENFSLFFPLAEYALQALRMPPKIYAFRS